MGRSTLANQLLSFSQRTLELGLLSGSFSTLTTNRKTLLSDHLLACTHGCSGLREANPEPHIVLVFRPRLPSKSMPHLPGAPRPASSLPPSSGKAPSTQAHSSTPGNIRPGKREGKAEPEKKDPEKKVASEPPIKGRAPLVKVEEVTVEEGTAAKPPDPGKKGPACAGVRVGALCLPCPRRVLFNSFFITGYWKFVFSFFLFPFSLSPLLSSLLSSLSPFLPLFSFFLSPAPLCIVNALTHPPKSLNTGEDHFPKALLGADVWQRACLSLARLLLPCV